MPDTIYAEEHNIFRDTFKKFVAKEIAPNVDKWESQRAVPRELWLKMGTLSIFAGTSEIMKLIISRNLGLEG